MKNKTNSPLIKRFNFKRRARSPHSDVVKIKTENNGFGLLKAILVFGIIIFQLLIFISFHAIFTLSYTWAAISTFSISVITCIYVLSSNKNSQSKAVWIIFLLIFFPFAYVFYLLSDERLIMLGAGRKYKDIFLKSQSFINKDKIESDNKNVVNDCTYLYKSGNFCTYKDTKCQYYPSGTLFFDDVIDRLKNAKEYIFMEFFIIADGTLFNRIFSILEQKVKEGVDVRIIYDDMGSHKVLSRKTKKKMLSTGIKIHPFNKILPILSLALNYRDHRKIIIIDGKTAYSGGCNLADEYINEKRLHGYWKDAGIRIDGQAVDGFTLCFLRQWEFLTKDREDYSKFLNKADKYPSHAVVVPYADGLDYGNFICKSVFENMIAGANEKIYIMTPYFIVDDSISNLLTVKAMSGVDVRIIIPEVPDKSFVYGVTRNNAEKLINYGVKVYCMKNSFVHSKLLLTENSAVVGSMNMDLRSFYQQFECAVYSNDHKLMSDILLDFNNTFNESKIITEKNKLRKHILYRMFAGIMQIFAPFM